MEVGLFILTLTRLSTVKSLIILLKSLNNLKNMLSRKVAMTHVHDVCHVPNEPSLPAYTSLDREKYEMLKGLCKYSSPVLSCRQVVQLYEL